MKILLVSYFGLEHGGGMATATKMLVEELSKRGHQVSWACSEDLGVETGDTRRVGGQWFKLPKIRQIPNLEWRDRILGRRLRQILTQNDFEVVHVTDVRFMAVAVLKTVAELEGVETATSGEASNGRKIPVVIDYRDYWFCCLKGDLLYQNQKICAGMRDRQKCHRCLNGASKLGQKYWIDHKYHYFQERLNWLKKAQQQLPVSQCVADKMAAFGLMERVTVMYDTIVDQTGGKITLKERAAFRRQNHWEDKVVITFAGKLIYHRGIASLLKVAEMLKKTAPQAVLVMIGSGEMEAAVREAVERKRLVNVRLIGQIPTEQMPLYLQTSDIFIFPSLFDEPFSRAVLEAVFAEKPVVASNLGGLKEVITDGKNGWLINPQQPRAMVAKLQLLIENPQLRAEMAMAARQVKKRFVPERYFQKLEEIYEAAVQEVRSGDDT